MSNVELVSNEGCDMNAIMNPFSGDDTQEQFTDFKEYSGFGDCEPSLDTDRRTLEKCYLPSFPQCGATRFSLPFQRKLTNLEEVKCLHNWSFDSLDALDGMDVNANQVEQIRHKTSLKELSAAMGSSRDDSFELKVPEGSVTSLKYDSYPSLFPQTDEKVRKMYLEWVRNSKGCIEPVRSLDTIYSMSDPTEETSDVERKLPKTTFPEDLVEEKPESPVNLHDEGRFNINGDKIPSEADNTFSDGPCPQCVIA